MRALIIEDDYWFSQEIVDDLGEAVPALKGSIDRIKTEKQFRQRFGDESAKLNYDLIILDIMVKWDEKSAASIPDKDVREEGYFRAGIRCLGRIRIRPETASTPVVIHSALEPELFLTAAREKEISMTGIEIVPKSGKSEPLIETVRRLLLPPL